MCPDHRYHGMGGPFLFFFLFFAINSYAQDLDWLPIPYSYIAKDESLTDILVNFGANYDSAVIVSHKVNEQVSGHFAQETPKAFLQQLTNLYNLTWYYDGSVLYVFKNSEVQSKLIKLENTTVKTLRKTLIDSGIWDKKFSWKPDPHHQLVYVSGPPRYIELVMQTVSALEQQATMQQEQGLPLAIQVFSLKYASAVDRIIKYRDEQIQVPGLATILANMVSAAEISQINNDKIISQKPNGHKAMIQPEPSINAIIVRDLPERMPMYQRLIHSLDKPTARIEVALSIIDVNADNLSELGIDWGVGLKAGQHHQINIASTLTQAASPVLGSLLDKQGLNYLVAKVSLLQSQGIAQVVSKPTLLTQENTQAIIDHNETYYIKVNGERVAELKGITYGTLLQMTPRVIQIGDKPEIHLVLHIEDGNQKPNSSGVDGIPTINRTIIDTVARVEQGQSLVIGGIFRDEVIKTSRKVPLLGDIPLLGALFRSQSNQTRRAVRIFIVEPKIIDKGLAKYLSVGNQRILPKRLLNIDEISNQNLPLSKILSDAQCQSLAQAKRIQSMFKQANKEAIIASCNKADQPGWRVIDLSCSEDQIECIYKAYQ
ncbi:MAG TPA: type III secretion system outer membrane ring subunit SctC [Arsenophonus nasoniae]